MSDRMLPTEEQALREQLRQEAAQSRPEFSESLHQRIAGAIREHHAAIAATHRAIAAKHGRRGLVALLTAACLLAAVAIGWRFIHPVAPQDRGNDIAQAHQAWLERRQAIDDWANQTTAGLDHLVASATPQSSTGVLTHDARLVASTLLQPLPVDMPLGGEP
jgi:hypothetical protein